MSNEPDFKKIATIIADNAIKKLGFLQVITQKLKDILIPAITEQLAVVGEKYRQLIEILKEKHSEELAKKDAKILELKSKVAKLTETNRELTANLPQTATLEELRIGHNNAMQKARIMFADSQKQKEMAQKVISFLKNQYGYTTDTEVYQHIRDNNFTVVLKTLLNEIQGKQEQQIQNETVLEWKSKLLAIVAAYSDSLYDKQREQLLINQQPINAFLKELAQSITENTVNENKDQLLQRLLGIIHRQYGECIDSCIGKDNVFIVATPGNKSVHNVFDKVRYKEGVGDVILKRAINGETPILDITNNLTVPPIDAIIVDTKLPKTSKDRVMQRRVNDTNEMLESEKINVESVKSSDVVAAMNEVKAAIQNAQFTKND